MSLLGKSREFYWESSESNKADMEDDELLSAGMQQDFIAASASMALPRSSHASAGQSGGRDSRGLRSPQQLRPPQSREHMQQSPHFTLNTPRASRSPSPASGRLSGEPRDVNVSPGAENVDIATPTVTDQTSESGFDALQYEWQFEIMNNLPRDRAIALVAYLRSAEKERSQAAELARKLQQSNGELEKRLLNQEKCSSAKTRRCCWPLCRVTLLFFAIVPLAATLAQVALPPGTISGVEIWRPAFAGKWGFCGCCHRYAGGRIQHAA